MRYYPICVSTLCTTWYKRKSKRYLYMPTNVSKHLRNSARGDERFHLRKVQVYRSIARHIRYVGSVSNLYFAITQNGGKERKRGRSSVILRTAFLANAKAEYTTYFKNASRKNDAKIILYNSISYHSIRTIKKFSAL